MFLQLTQVSAVVYFAIKKKKKKPLTHLVSLNGPQIQALSETLKRKMIETAFLLKEEGGNQPVWSQHKTP